MKQLIIIALLVSIVGCNEKNARKPDKNDFIASEIGWTVTRPEKWEPVPGVENENSPKKDILHIRKDPSNSFMASISSFDGNYDTHLFRIRKSMKSVYANATLKVEFEEGKEEIDGLSFDLFSVKVPSAINPQQFQQVKTYTRLINGYIFSMALMFDNIADLSTMADMIKNSEFTIRK